jgi:chorismate synthase
MTHLGSGRVAAGAIAEIYLKQAFGIDIVAFVTSVGKVHLPSTLVPSLVATDQDEDNDQVQDALSPEFTKLLATITREQVDQYPTRCPDAETSARMTKVISPTLI